MSAFINQSATYAKGAPTVLLDALLRLIDMGGKDLRVYVINGDEVNTLRDVHASNIANCNAVAVYFTPGAAEGHVNPRAARIALEAVQAGKSLAIVGVQRKTLKPEVQAACAWVIY